MEKFNAELGSIFHARAMTGHHEMLLELLCFAVLLKQSRRKFVEVMLGFGTSYLRNAVRSYFYCLRVAKSVPPQALNSFLPSGHQKSLIPLGWGPGFPRWVASSAGPRLLSGNPFGLMGA